MNCIHCGNKLYYFGKYCKSPACQEAKRQARNARATVLDVKAGRRAPLSDRICEYCNTHFEGQRNRRFCLLTPECKEAQKESHNIAARRRQREVSWESRFRFENLSHEKLHKCRICGKMSVNYWYCPPCHSSVSKYCVDPQGTQYDPYRGQPIL